MPSTCEPSARGFVYSLSGRPTALRARRASTDRVLVCGAVSCTRPVLDHSTRGARRRGASSATALVPSSSRLHDDAERPERHPVEVRLHAEGEVRRASSGSKLRAQAFQPKRIMHVSTIDREVVTSRRMQGRFVFKNAVTRMPEVLLETLGHGEPEASTTSTTVPVPPGEPAHQRIRGQPARRSRPRRCPANIDRYGNCSAASIPMLLDEGVRERPALRSPATLVAMTELRLRILLEQRPWCAW